MGNLADAVRPFLVVGISRVTGRPQHSFGNWLVKGNYQFFDPVIDVARFRVHYSDGGMLDAVAYDINRFCMASFESIAPIVPGSTLPRSTSWLGVRAYYSAYYAALSLLRIFGVILTRIEEESAVQLATVAGLYSELHVSHIESGLYQITIDTARDRLDMAKREPRGGAHAALWTAFRDLIRRLSEGIIERTSQESPDRTVVSKLDEFARSLAISGRPPYWLSDTRNTINYQLRLGAWYPYHGRNTTFANAMFRAAKMWENDPMSIDVRAGSAEDFGAFLRCCCFVVSMAREVVLDIVESTEGRSFLHYGVRELLAQIRGVA